MSTNQPNVTSSSSSSSAETVLFQTVFSRLVSAGEPPNAAAAKALLTLQEYLSSAENKEVVVKEAMAEKMDIEVEEVAARSIADLLLMRAGVFSEKQAEKHTLSAVKLEDLLISCANSGSDFAPFGEALAETLLSSAGTQHAFGREVAAPDFQRTGGAAAINFDKLSTFVAGVERASPIAYEMYNSIVEMLIDRLASQDREKICDASVAESVVALEYPGLMDPSKQELLTSLMSAIDRFPEQQKTCLFEWIKSFAGRERYLRYITLCRQYMTVKLYEEAHEDAKLAVRVMGILYSALPRYRSVSVMEFYNDALNEEYMTDPRNVSAELREWTRERLSKRRGRVFLGLRFNSFISYAFVLSPVVKATVLRLDAENQMRREIRNEVHNAIFRGDQYYTPFLVLRVSRERVLGDTLSQIMLYEFKEADFKLPLKVMIFPTHPLIVACANAAPGNRWCSTTRRAWTRAACARSTSRS